MSSTDEKTVVKTIARRYACQEIDRLIRETVKDNLRLSAGILPAALRMNHPGQH